MQQRSGGVCTRSETTALELFKAVQIFNPKQLSLLSRNFDDYVSTIPSLATAADEWQAYVDTASRESLPDDISVFW